AVPLFFFAILCFIYLFEILAIETSIHSGLQYAGKLVVQSEPLVPLLSSSELETDIVQAVGKNRLDRSIIVNGSQGIDCSKSHMSVRTGVGELIVKYRIRIPVPLFYRNGIVREDSILVKAWNGYEKEIFDIRDEQIVYLTETGLVYHKDYHCTYLDLSIQMVKSEEIDNLRNENGAKYTSCIRCGSKKDNVYITRNGDKYHSSLNCSGLKRTVYAVPLSEVIGKGACTRCG
ncbi:MAG: pilus assembly protein, partial [Lachnospiraceae bacterium]|nr:pilus assembly protein [Lachnospiraceae bacterium]